MPKTVTHTPDHPRSRGVYINAFNYGTSNTGSSPLARGLRTKIPFLGDATGIIPARAGFTTHEHRPDGCAADHPRSRGVYAGLDAEEMEVVGSSPLARGLRVPIHPGRLGGRIIPARAGFTPHHRQLTRPYTDHPRSRGVYRASFFSDIAHEGSSPLARGLPGRDYGHPERTRIIPARAGFTWKAPRASLGPPDHPRSRGVYRRSRRQR